MKKKLCYFLIFAMLLTCVPVMNTKAASRKAQAISTTKSLMKVVKRYDAKGINKYVKSWGKLMTPDDCNQFTYMKKYLKWANKKMSYKILSTSVSGNTAKVKLRIKYTNGQNFADDFLSLVFLDVLSRGDEEISDSELLKLWNKYAKIAYLDATQEKRKYKTEAVTITYGRYSGKWKIKKMPKKFANIIYANYLYASDHFME